MVHMNFSVTFKSPEVVIFDVSVDDVTPFSPQMLVLCVGPAYTKSNF